MMARVGFRASILLVAGLVVLPGCGSEQYSDRQEYPVRSDFLVVMTPKAQPTVFNNPGRLPLDFLDSLPTTYSAAKKSQVIDVARVEAEVKAGKRTVNANQQVLLDELKSNNILDARTLHEAERQVFREVLNGIFGTPAHPKVKKKTETDPFGYPPEVVDKLKLDEKSLHEGSKLYRQHCLHCHGLDGNGRGPTGYWVNPPPRDYRQGVFKFTSSTQDQGERKPLRADLVRTLVYGIEGTSMPAFNILSPTEIDQIVSYVIHLSLRGELEFFVMQQWIGSDKRLWTAPRPDEIESARKDLILSGKSADEVQKALKEITDVAAQPNDKANESLGALKQMFVSFDDINLTDLFGGRWLKAQESGIVPDPYPYPDTKEAFLESAHRGSQLFVAGSASCASCHKNYGQESALYYDAWGTIVKPRDFINGFYRGGSKPIDLYNRVYSGINGAGMTAYATELRPTDDDKAKKQDKIWDLVNFMQAMHFPEMRAELRKKGVQID